MNSYALEETHQDESTAIVDGSVSVDQQATECLRLLSRVRKETSHWPGPSESWQWLYCEDLTPQRIGRFEIRRRLGVRGFGIVFLAHDPRLDRDVALKVPKLESMVSRRRTTIPPRVQTVAALSHPNIAQSLKLALLSRWLILLRLSALAGQSTICCCGRVVPCRRDRQLD